MSKALMQKLEEFKLFLNETDQSSLISAIYIDETWCTQTIDYYHFNMNCFSMITQDCQCSPHGGLRLQ